MVIASNTTFQNFSRGGQLGYSSPNMPTFGAGIINTAPASNSPGKFETIFNGALSIGSQIISGWGKNQTTQISGNNGQVQALPTPYGSAGQVTTAQQQAALQQAAIQQQSGGVGASAVGVGASFLDGIAQSFGISTSMLTLFGIGGLYLLFRTPPKSR